MQPLADSQTFDILLIYIQSFCEQKIPNNFIFQHLDIKIWCFLLLVWTEEAVERQIFISIFFTCYRLNNWLIHCKNIIANVNNEWLQPYSIFNLIHFESHLRFYNFLQLSDRSQRFLFATGINRIFKKSGLKHWLTIKLFSSWCENVSMFKNLIISNSTDCYCSLFEGESQQSSDTTGSVITSTKSVGNFITLRLKKQAGRWEVRMVSADPYTLKVTGENSLIFIYVQI